MTNDYKVSLERSSPRPMAAVHARLPFASVPASFGRYLDQVYAAAKAGAVQLDGQNIFLYRVVPDRRTEADVAFGVGVKAPFAATGAVVPTSLPVGEVATTTHRGSYAGLRGAHDAVQQWCNANQRRLTGTSWEVYGHMSDDETKIRTDVFYLLEPAENRS